MSQYFIESKSKQPIFFSFNRILENQEILDYDLFIKDFQENFEQEQQDNWCKYWNKQGEEQVLKTWNEKYKDYLKTEQESEEQQDQEQEENCPKEDKETFEKEIETANTSTSADILLPEKSWEDLWQEHREEIYCEQYLIFTTIYYNYFLDLKKSCETPQPIAEDLEEVEEEQEEEADLLSSQSKLTEELEQLKILGLPTSFGGRPQNSSKKQKPRNKTIHYSDYFSDSEMDNDSNGSDFEEYDKEQDAKEIEEDSLHGVQEKPISKQQKKKRNRKLKNVPSFILEEKGLLKYWRKRFSLFSRFDEGIQLDRESWFSVTPEKVAKHLAERLKCSIIVDGFCGSGGNVIQFAFTCDKVIAIDIDPVKLEMAKHNAEIYKVSHKIEFILGDFLQLAAGGKLKADIVFLSPPWGGPKYKNKKEFDIEKYLLPVKASELVATSRNVSENIGLFLPRNSSVKQIVKLAGIGNRCEIEHNYLDSRLVAITALYGEEILSKKATT
ncbi:trimethylguanosine synthase [Lucilia sericata]|uniref:trimethylguanosine synthase n=1 Tax=Lucilia sericata TaxID=13632 RepID=UPI0018A8633B|nr:trimethylguanosine synthase [Lucilia sericata]XP_037816573.1 trimethylguanosine synthase [Lucilia sericata]